MSKFIYLSRAVAFALVTYSSSSLLAQVGPQLQVNGDAVGPVGLTIGQEVAMTLAGPPSQPFALGVGFQAAQISTPVGTLGFDPRLSTSFLFLDGFDGNHPLHAISHLEATGLFTLFTTPFRSGPAGTVFWSQAVAADPSLPEGMRLGNTLEISSIAAPPTVTSTIPHFSTAGGSVYLTGTGFEPLATQNTVRIGDRICTVLGGDTTWLSVQLPLDATSGPISVTNSAGTGGGGANDLHSWCAVLTSFVPEAQVPAIITQSTTILGHIGLPGEADNYQVMATAGQEIIAEVYSWDPNVGEITGPANTWHPYFDPIVEIRWSAVTVAADDDSGPHVNAAVGLDTGSTHFVADQTGTYTVHVDGYHSISSGAYVLLIDVRTPVNRPLNISSVHPNAAIPGQIVQVYSAGITGTDPSLYWAAVGATPIAPFHVQPGRLDFVLPSGVTSGAVNIAGPQGVTAYGENDMNSWVCVIDSNMIFGSVAGSQIVTTPVTAGQTIFGQLTTGSEVDNYPFQVTAGRHYRIEVCAFSDSTGQLVTGGFLVPGPLDPELIITLGTTTLMYDASSGPGLNPTIGNSVSPPFIPSLSGTCNIRIQSLLGITNGSYLLNIVDITP